jgi:hypothetical protein
MSTVKVTPESVVVDGKVFTRYPGPHEVLRWFATALRIFAEDLDLQARSNPLDEAEIATKLHGIVKETAEAGTAYQMALQRHDRLAVEPAGVDEQ